MSKEPGMMASQSLGLAGAARETAKTVVNTQVNLHERELAGWNYLQRALENLAPTALEEVALWEMLSRARRETRY